MGLSISCLAHEGAFLYDPNYQDKLKVQSAKLKVKEEGVLTEAEEERDRKRDLEGSFRVEESYLRPVSRKEAYLSDITYGTNHEFGFDYLRDNLVQAPTQKVQRGFNYAIIDEVDSVLIDEARTPLIISSPDDESSKLYKDFARIAPRLKEAEDFEIDEKMKAAFLTEKGVEKIEQILGLSNIYESHGIKYLHYIEQSLKAQRFFKKDIDYIINNGEVIIIDEFTGRIMPGRRWSGGLHQAIEAKEGVQVKEESKTMATITFQNYFRLYKKLAGMTGTALTSAEEFDKVYHLKVISIPTNKPVVRLDKPDQIFKTEKGKLKAIVEEIKKRNALGQPILIGTRSVEKNEYLSALLRREGIRHEILNAKNHQREGEIIAQAGKLGAVMVATNMAGRGVDIMLGGVPPNKGKRQKAKGKIEKEGIINKTKALEEGQADDGRVSEEYKAWEKERGEVIQLGGLYVLGTERHEARRIDNQLRGRSGRQGDAGCSQFFVSLEDELMRIFGGEKIQQVMTILKVEEDQPIESKMISSVIEKAQTKVEGLNFDSRKYILEYDDVISKQRNKIYAERNKVLEMNFQELKDFILDILNQEITNIFQMAENPATDLKAILPLKEEEIKDEEQVLVRCEELLKEKENKEGQEGMTKALRFVVLKTLDDFWTEHLVNLDHLKDSVRLRAYGGRDPLVEYKTESHKMFQGLIAEAHSQIAHLAFKISFNKMS
ncbi:preprotein translocase subunit SecA [Candidatus Parcubacteria bacterium]|nr:preprotein translocase subunit SecA [Candidatus Parcubacteria bacterium]